MLLCSLHIIWGTCLHVLQEFGFYCFYCLQMTYVHALDSRNSCACLIHTYRYIYIISFYTLTINVIMVIVCLIFTWIEFSTQNTILYNVFSWHALCFLIRICPFVFPDMQELVLRSLIFFVNVLHRAIRFLYMHCVCSPFCSCFYLILHSFCVCTLIFLVLTDAFIGYLFICWGLSEILYQIEFLMLNNEVFISKLLNCTEIDSAIVKYTLFMFLSAQKSFCFLIHV